MQNVNWGSLAALVIILASCSIKPGPTSNEAGKKNVHTAAEQAHTQQTQINCVPNGGCLREEVATTSNPWWFQVGSLSLNVPGEDYTTTTTQLINVPSIKTDLSPIRTFSARVLSEELDKRHFTRTGDTIFEITVQVDCNKHRFRMLEAKTGSSASLNGHAAMPWPDRDWQQFDASFVYNGLHGTALAQAVC